MPEHDDTLYDATRLSCRQVLYSCQYDQLLYRRQHVVRRHVSLPSSGGQHAPDSGTFECGSTCNNGSCNCTGMMSNSIQRDQEVRNETESRRENRIKNVRLKRYRMTAHLGERNFRYNQRISFLESEHSRRRRFPTVAQRKAANVREQRRMCNLKEAFKALRECLPTFSYEKKMSRIETLRLSIAYISFLRKLLNDREQDTLTQISKNQSETGREC